MRAAARVQTSLEIGLHVYSKILDTLAIPLYTDFSDNAKQNKQDKENENDHRNLSVHRNRV